MCRRLLISTFLTLSLPLGCYAQEQQPRITDPAQLVGKKVDVGRLPLCKPGTYTYDLAHAGMRATVVSVKPHKPPISFSAATISKAPPEARPLLEDQLHAATLLLEFEDGTKWDTCAPMGPNMLAEYLTLAPEQSLALVPATEPAPTRLVDVHPEFAGFDKLSAQEVERAVAGEGKDHRLAKNMLDLYMPEARIYDESRIAKRQFLPYVPSDTAVLRGLTVYADALAGGPTICQEPTRIVLASASPEPDGQFRWQKNREIPSADVQEAAFSERVTFEGAVSKNPMLTCYGLQAMFPLSSVAKARASALKGEFFVIAFFGSNPGPVHKLTLKEQAKLGLQ